MTTTTTPPPGGRPGKIRSARHKAAGGPQNGRRGAGADEGLDGPQAGAEPPTGPFRVWLRWAFDQRDSQDLEPARRLIADRDGPTVTDTYARKVARGLGWQPTLTVLDGQGEGDDIAGLGPGEEVTTRYRWAGDTFVRIYGERVDMRGEPHTWVRVARVEAKGGRASYRPIGNYDLIVERHEVVEAFDDIAGSLNGTMIDEAYTLVRDDDAGIARFVVRESQIVDARKRSDWMVAGGLARRTREDRHQALRELIHALVHNFAGKRIRGSEVTGLLREPGGLVYVPPRGQAFDVNGPRDDIVARLPAGVGDRHAALVEYDPAVPDFASERTRDGLTALVELVRGHGDLGVSGVLTGHVVAGQASGLRLADELECTQAVPFLEGDTGTGKTAFAQLVTTSQTRTLSGEVVPDGELGRDAGTTAAGVVHHHRHYRGLVWLADNVFKRWQDDAAQRRTHSEVLARLVAATVGGGGWQAQANDSGPVSAAPRLSLGCSATATSELPPPVTSLVEDSVANKLAVLWWHLEHRCDAATFARLQSQAHTLARNDGLRACLHLLLGDVEVVVAGYRLALRELRAAGVHERIAKNYARCLSGLHVLDLALGRAGLPAGVLDEVLPGAIAQAQRMMAYGTTGSGDQLAQVWPWVAFVEAFRHLLATTTLWVDLWGNDDPAAMPELDPGRAILPPGTSYTDWGVSPRGQELLQGKVNAGRMVAQPTGPGRRLPFDYCVELTSAQWSTVVDECAAYSRRHGHRTAPRDELTAAGLGAGALVRSKGARGTQRVVRLDARVVHALDHDEWPDDEGEG